jgi:hypothetical protein
MMISHIMMASLTNVSLHQISFRGAHFIKGNFAAFDAAVRVHLDLPVAVSYLTMLLPVLWCLSGRRQSY